MNVMKKIILLIVMQYIISSCGNNSNSEKHVENNIKIETISNTKELNRKLIEICEGLEGVEQADVRENILTIRANISKVEAQKLGDGILEEITKYRKDIDIVTICNIDFEVLSISKI